MTKLAGKVALVTGGVGGLGQAIARRLALDGAIVAISDLETKRGQAIASEEGFIFLPHDVCDEAAWLTVVGEVEQRLGGLDILVNNAGITGPTGNASPEETSFDDWKKVLAVNLDGVFLGCKAALPAMRRRGSGSIVNLSSVAGLLATPYGTAYGASKAAVRQLTKSVAQHCAQQKLNIRCNSVHPGNVRGPLWERIAKDMAKVRGVDTSVILAETEATVPMGDFTTPEDVAAAVVFLASDDARHITGTKVIVDGGMINCSSYHVRSGARQLIAERAAAARDPS